MDTKKAKQRVTLALDTCGMRGRFTVRDVAETALREIRYDDLSETDKREALMNFLMREAKGLMKAPLRGDLKEEMLQRVPPKHWPILEKLSKTICVSGGAAAYHVYTLYATRDDWAAFLELAEIMDQRAKSAKNAGRNIRDLLVAEGAMTLHEMMTGRPSRILAIADDRGHPMTQSNNVRRGREAEGRNRHD